MDDRTLARFMRKIEVQPNGCWKWLGKRNAQGYGYFWLDGKSRLAHRVSHEHFIGVISEGDEVDHLCHTRDSACPGGICDHRACVNPNDLESVSGYENVMRSRGLAPVNAAKEFCAQGHPFDAENTYWYPGERERACRKCRAGAVKTWSQVNRPSDGPRNSEKTHCKRGHEFSGSNTHLSPTGKRVCVTCRRDVDREAKRLKRATAKASSS